MGVVMYCKEEDTNVENMIEVILKQSNEKRSRGYFNFSQQIPKYKLEKVDKRMKKLTSKLNVCSIK
jgi:hypothetical protein